MSNNGKIIYGGEAFEQNRDPSPGLGMGEIRYFVNEPTDPRWLKCDGNVHKRSTYSAYAATRPLPAWRFSKITSDIIGLGEFNFIKYLSQGKKLQISETEIIFATDRTIAGGEYRGIMKYNTENGDWSLLVDFNEVQVETTINFQNNGYLYKFNNMLFYIDGGAVIYSSDLFETYNAVLHDISGLYQNSWGGFDPAHFMNEFWMIIYSDNGFGRYVPYISFDGFTFEFNDNVDFYPNFRDYAIFHHNDILFSNDSDSFTPYIIEAEDTTDFLRRYDDLKEEVRPVGFPSSAGINTYASCISGNRFVITEKIPGWSLPWTDKKYLNSNLEKNTQTLGSLNNQVLFCTGYTLNEIGFLQTHNSDIEMFTFSSHRDLSGMTFGDTDVPITSQAIYASEGLYLGNNMSRMAYMDGKSKNSIEVYVDGRGDMPIEVYHDPEYFHAPGLRASKIDGSFPYVWTGE